MKNFIIALLTAASLATTCYAETVTLKGAEYQITTLQDRELGPGVRYTRIRIPEYPLNVNILRIDASNPYNSIETTQASDKLYGTEALVNAAKRQTSTGHVALAGANANFWCVNGQPPFSDELVGLTYNGNLRNGKIISETNMHADQWNGGYKHTGIVGITPEGSVHSGNYFSWAGYINSTATGELEIYTVNKTVRDNEVNIYNSYYPTNRPFKCVDTYTDNGTTHFKIVPKCATEVYLNIEEGQKWNAGGKDITFTVAKVVQDAGAGTLANYDLAIVGRGDKREALNRLKPGDKVTLRYGWSDKNGKLIEFDNLVGGNAQVMNAGTLTKYNTSETYNSQVYSRTGYGTDDEGRYLYIIVIDKSTDPRYGTSAGCSTTEMCAIAQHYGCTYMTNFDAGGSAEMLVGNAIVNKTTEASPRAVANGMIIYSIAPEDNEITRLEFADYNLKAPVYGTYTPRIIGYNKYDAVVSDDVQGIVLSCDPNVGTCNGNVFSAGGIGVVAPLTASLGSISVSKDITIVDTQMALRIKPILIDSHREYPVEASAEIDGNTYTYNPAGIIWTVADPSVAFIDANGVLHGLKDGTTEITATIGRFSDTTPVTVEIAKKPYYDFCSWADWKAMGTAGIVNAAGKTALTISDNGTINFTYKTPRDPYMYIARDITFYSLPDEISFDFTSSIPVSKVVVDARTRLHSRTNNISITAKDSESFAAEKTHHVTLPWDAIGDKDDLITYPVSMHQIRFVFVKDAANKGDQTVQVSDVKATYKYYDGIADVAATNAATLSVWPNPVSGTTFTVRANAPMASVSIYSLGGTLVSKTPANGESVMQVATPATAGVYIVAAKYLDGAKICTKLMAK